METLDEMRAKLEAYEKETEKRRTYHREYQRKRRGRLQEAAAKGDEKAVQLIEERKEKNRMYQREFAKRHSKKEDSE